jgi:hypothetical protein
MGETDVEIGTSSAIPQTPARSGGANDRRAALPIFKADSLLSRFKGPFFVSFFAFFKNYYLPVFFGVFGIFSLQAAGVANDQALVANQLALLSLCSGNSVIFLNLLYERIHH